MEQLDLELISCIGYDNSKMKVVSDMAIAFLNGSRLIIWDLSNNERKEIQSKKQGFQCFTTNAKQGLIVLIEYELNPSIQVYRNMKLEKTINNLVEFEVIDLILSRDGSKLAIVQGSPSYELIIYDLNSNSVIKGDNTQIIINHDDYVDFEFNPCNNKEFAILNDSHLIIYKLESEYTMKINQEDELKRQYRLQQQSVQLEDQSSVKRIKWDQMNNIYLSQENMVSIYRNEDMEVIMKKELQSSISHMLMSQMHLIVVYKNNYMEWLFKYDPQFVNDKSTEPLTMDKYFLFLDGNIINILYDHFLNNIILSTDDHSVQTLAIKGQNLLDEEEEDQEKQDSQQDEEEDNNNRIECEPIKYGPHSQNTQLFLHKLKAYDILLSVTNKAEIQLIDIITRNIIRNYYFQPDILSFEIDSQDKLLVMGTHQGCIRILDSRDLNNIQTIHCQRFFDNKTIDFLKFYNSKILVGSKQSKKIHVLGIQNEEDQFSLLGILVLPSLLVNIQIDSSNNILLLINYMVLQLNSLDYLDSKGFFDWKLNNIKCRKVDPNLQFGFQMENIIYMIGKDKMLKVYPQCEEDLYDYDLKIKIPAGSSQQEFEGYSMEMTSMVGNNKYIVCGSKNGAVYVREHKNLEKLIKIQAHSLQKGGVSSLFISQDSTLLMAGGYDSSIFIYNINKNYEYEQNVNLKQNDVQIPYSNLNKMEDSAILNYKQIQIDLENQQLKLQNRQNEEELKGQIDEIKVELQKLIQKNKNAEEMERLDIDEFCINLEKKERVHQQCIAEQNVLKQQAKRQIQVQQQIFTRIEEQTYDQMEVHLKAINGINTNILVYNYQIKKFTHKESNHYLKVIQLRRMEIIEKFMRFENQIRELVKLQDLCKNPENYFVNIYPGKPEEFVFNDYEKKEEIKEKKGEQNKTQQGIKNKNFRPFQGFTVFRNVNDVKVDMEKQNNQIKQGDGQQQNALESGRNQQQQQQNHEQIQDLQTQIDKRPDLDNMSAWDYLYSQLELFSNNQKRNQIILISNIIQEIKQEYNTEFENACKYRQMQIESIIEKNKRIVEIQTDLKMGIEFFKSKDNAIENTEKVLQLTKEEVGMERYLSKEERLKVEEERLKEEERQRQLQKDDAGIRALKQMMGGTLAEKKETPLTENLVREEWMDKAVEELDDDQRSKLREFELKDQRLREEREKITKNLKNELQQLNSQIQDIYKVFDEKLLVLQKRKLEYDQRINEQYLLIIKLVQSILINSDRVNKIIEMQKFIADLDSQIQDMLNQQNLLKQYQQLMAERKANAQVNFDQALASQNKGELAIIPNIQQIYNQILDDNQLTQIKKEDQDNLPNHPNYKLRLFQIDPFFNEEIKEISTERETNFENFVPVILNNYAFKQLNINEDENLRNNVLSLFRKKFNLKILLNKSDENQKDLEKFFHYFQDLLIQQQELFQKNQSIQQKNINIQNQSKSDIEIMIRIKQGNVEIFQDRPVPSLQDAILIPQKEIEKLNREIKMQGNSQIESLNQIKNTKFDVAKAEYDKRKKNLELKQLDVKIKQIQMLKVRKEMQIALQKKDMKLNENELKNLTEQIKKIKETTEKRIDIIQKKEDSIQKEIQFILNENQQLSKQGESLNQTVKQRTQIKEMMDKKNNIKDKDEEVDNEATEKFNQINQVRKLHDQVVKYSEEIQLLRDELTKLKNKTFPEFPNPPNLRQGLLK